MENVIAFDGENCNVNCAINNHMGVRLIGCASHRNRLAAKEVLYDHKMLPAKVHRLTVKLRDPLIAPKLRKITELKGKVRNVIRCSSAFEMLRRYVAIRAFVDQLEEDYLEALLVNNSLERKVDMLAAKLSELEQVTKSLRVKMWQSKVHGFILIVY